MKREQLHVLQHSLGVDEYGRGARYRNHFCAGGKDLDTCRSLVAVGYMTERAATDLTGGDPCFHVTREGVAAMITESPQPPKLSRSAQRYREWLDADCGLKFGEWIRAKFYDADVRAEAARESDRRWHERWGGAL